MEVGNGSKDTDERVEVESGQVDLDVVGDDWEAILSYYIPTTHEDLDYEDFYHWVWD